MTLAGALLGDRRRQRGRRGDRGRRRTAGRGDPLPLAAHRAGRSPRSPAARSAVTLVLAGGDADARRRGRPPARSGSPTSPRSARRVTIAVALSRGALDPGSVSRREHRAAAAPPRARLLRRRGRARAAARAGDAGGRAADARPVADAAARRARARAGAVADGGQLRVHHGRARPGALRRRLPRDARPRRLRPGGVRGAARLHGRARARSSCCRSTPPRSRAYPRRDRSACIPGRPRRARRRPARARRCSRRPSSASRATAIRRMRWRSDFSSLPIRTIARKLSAQGEPRLRGVRDPGRDEGRSRCAPRLRGADVLAWVVVADARGRISLLPLGRVAGRTTTLTGPRPARARPAARARHPARAARERGVHARPRRGRGRGRAGAVGRGRPRPARRRRGGRVAHRLARLDAVDRRRRAAARRRGDDPLRLPRHRAPPGLPAGAADRRAGRCRSSSRPTSPARPAASARRPCSTSRTRRSTRGSSASRRGMPSVPADSRPVRARRRRLALDGARRERARRGDAARGLDLGAGRRRGRRPRAAAGRRSRASSSTRGGATERRLAGDPLAHATAVALGAAGLVALAARRARLLGRRGQRAARREERLLRPRGAGACARGHAPAAAHARRDPARARASPAGWRWPSCSRASSSR